jgi:hypothetical protein
MANFAGQTFALGAAQVSPTVASSDLLAGAASTSAPLGMPSASLSASRGSPQPDVTVAGQNLPGEITETFGGRLFERIIIVPPIAALGFVLTATQFPVEIWNTFRNVDQLLEAINISGSGGIAIDDVPGLPVLYAALDSRVYQATVPSAGTAQIIQGIAFLFLSGLSIDVTVTGSRITMFSVAPDWSEGVVESIEFLTNVLKAYSDAEQRRGLRQLPRRALTYRALTLTPRDAAGMESLLWGWQAQPYGVPWWQDATGLATDTPAGSFFIPCDTADRQFAPGGLLCIWTDEFTYEALSIENVAPDGVTVTSPTQFSWMASPATLVMPVFLARLGDKVKVERFTSGMDQIDLQFIGEAMQPAPAPAVALTQYLGIDVLEIPPNWEATLGREYERSMVTIDPKVGPITVIDKGGTAIVGQEFPWWLAGHSNVTAFRGFILRRFGQLNNFWIPTFDQDLVLADDAGAGDLGITVQSVYYSRFMFANQARTYLAFIPHDGSGNVYRRVTSAHDNGDGTESLALDSPTGKLFPAATTMVSFLTLARLGKDRIEIKWSTADLAESMLTFQEVPRELP